jgi:hypothetical protein
LKPEKDLTKEEWRRVEETLSGIYGLVRLKVDGHEVTLSRTLIDKNRLGVSVYVDGFIKGIWIGPKNDHPEQRYLCPRDRFKFSKKIRDFEKKTIKKLGKRRAKEMGISDPDEKVRFYSHRFPSGAAVRRHYQKTFKSIELVECGY